jgi:hypothetical protein
LFVHYKIDKGWKEIIIIQSLQKKKKEKKLIVQPIPKIKEVGKTCTLGCNGI